MSAAPVPAAAIEAAVAAARDFLRIGVADETSLLERLADAAILLAEDYTGMRLILRPVEEIVPACADWRALTALPMATITGVTARPATGAPLALAADAFAIDIDGEGRGWVRLVQPVAASRIAVAGTAGLAADWAGLPAPLAQGVTALIAHLFDDRTAAGPPPASVAALWRPWRRLRLAAAEMRA